MGQLVKLRNTGNVRWLISRAQRNFYTKHSKDRNNLRAKSGGQEQVFATRMSCIKLTKRKKTTVWAQMRIPPQPLLKWKHSQILLMRLILKQRRTQVKLSARTKSLRHPTLLGGRAMAHACSQEWSRRATLSHKASANGLDSIVCSFLWCLATLWCTMRRPLGQKFANGPPPRFVWSCSWYALWRRTCLFRREQLVSFRRTISQLLWALPVGQASQQASLIKPNWRNCLNNQRVLTQKILRLRQKTLAKTSKIEV